MAQSSVLRTGMWYKMAVEQRGVYKISYDQFSKMGFDAAHIDPRKIKIYGNEGGMLPQANGAARPVDLTENAIIVQGESDGAFNASDYILFYAQGPDLTRFDVNRGIYQYESNLYTEKNFYFITVSVENGKRIASSENAGAGFPVINTFEDFVYHEVDSYNELKSGREWFGERFDLTLDQTFSVELSGVTTNTEIKFVSDVMAKAYYGATFKMYFNGVLSGEQVIGAIPNTQYGLKGKHKRDTLSLNATTISAAGRDKQDIRYQYIKAGSGQSTGYLDFFLIQAERNLARYGNQTIFLSPKSLLQATSTFEIENFNDNCSLWDITNPYEPKIQLLTVANNKATFSTATGSLKTFIVFNTTTPSPEFIGKVANQNLHGLLTPNVIIVTHPDFKSEAQRLASHRQHHSNMTAIVVTPEEIYNEFSSGRQDVSAIRDFVKNLYDKNPAAPKALLLMGRGSYDYKNRLQTNTNFIPTYESRNSLDPLETYSSDDFFGFLEATEGNWGESSPVQNHTLDIGVGRLPVKTLSEANEVVSKIMLYDTNKKSFGRWRKNIVFVADDGSTSDGFTRKHQEQANSMADEIDMIHPEFDTRKTFLGMYSKIVKPSGETMPEVNKKIAEDFNRALIINYTGHGSERLWADERVFTNFDIEDLDNTLYPFLVTATCEFGRQDDPAEVSSAELSLLHPHGGSIGLVTTARPVYSYTNFELNQAFYDALFQKESNHYLSIGEIFRRTKNNSFSGVGNRNFSLLGDPSLTLAMPSLTTNITEIKTTSGSDTLKALSMVIVKGDIRDSDNVLVTDFNGTLEATLFDKLTDFATIGKNNPPFQFSQWSNVLFRGKASVENGLFEFTFQVSKNMAYQIAPGKLSLYAFDPQQHRDAAGASSSFKIGGSEDNPDADNTPPIVKLFMGDTTFVDGGLVSPQTTLLVNLTDNSGINISNYGIGNTIVAVLDDDAGTFVISDYYESDQDNFTQGWVRFPMNDLTPGKHTITVKAWDAHNNPAQATITFTVTDEEGLIIESFANYPNPFQHETTLYFTHNRSGDDLQGELHIYEMTGRHIKSYEFSITESPYEVTVMEWQQADKKLPSGVYLARVAVRSLSNGSKNERVTKLIITN